MTARASDGPSYELRPGQKTPDEPIAIYSSKFNLADGHTLRVYRGIHSYSSPPSDRGPYDLMEVSHDCGVCELVLAAEGFQPMPSGIGWPTYRYVPVRLWVRIITDHGGTA